MSSTTDIQNKWQVVYNVGLDLGAKTGAEQDAGYGGRYQQYNNARIYWHDGIGTFLVHGGILTKYLSGGGTGVNTAVGRRDLGFPTTDETRLAGDDKVASHFEWGAIYWAYDGRRISGDIFNYYKTIGEGNSDLGFPISDNTKLLGGEIVYFEFGCLFKPDGSLPVMHFSFTAPLIGNPHFTDTTSGNSLENSLTIKGRIEATSNTKNYFNSHPLLLQQLYTGKLSLREIHKAGVSSNFIHLEIIKPVVTIPQYDIPIDLPTAPGSHQPSHPTVIALYIDVSAVAKIPAEKSLANRQLYDLCFTVDTSKFYIVSPHCFYSKTEWDDFGIIHVTDTHVGRRYDWLKHQLKKHSELQQAYSLFMNPNDNFRNMIKYANRLYDQGKLDVIMHTGDMIDYIFENDDYKKGSGNYGFFLNLLLGKIKYADDAGTPADELRVPILTTLGNHDYRPYAYDPYIDIDIDTGAEVGGGIGDIVGSVLGSTIGDAVGDAIGDVIDATPFVDSSADWLIGEIAGSDLIQRQYTDWNLTQAEAIFSQSLWGRGKKTPEALAASFITKDPTKLYYYKQRINRTGSFIKSLGKNRLVMLDTGPDAVVITKLTKAIEVKKLGQGSEADKRFFEGGDTVGFSDDDITSVKNALIDSGATGAFIIGIHAPAINPDGGEYNHYFRETEHPTIDPRMIAGFLLRHKEINGQQYLSLKDDESVNGWIVSKTLNFKKKDLGDMLDNGTPYKNLQPFWELCLGRNHGSILRRKVDLVVSGHIHKNTEWRLGWSNENNWMRCYFDFYTENPIQYYSSTHIDKITVSSKPEVPSLVTTKKVHLTIKQGAKVNGTIEHYTDHQTTPNISFDMLDIPPNQNTLNTSINPLQWWNDHRPLITQTSCLGWNDNYQRQDPDISEYNGFQPEPLLTGLRLIQIHNNVINKMNYVKHDQIM